MVDDPLKPVGLINGRVIEPREVRTAKDWAEALLEAALRFAFVVVERSIKQVSKRQPSDQRIDEGVSALVNSGWLTGLVWTLMSVIRKVMEAEGVQRMNKTAESIAYQVAIRRLNAEMKLIKRPPGRPRAQTARSSSMPISHAKRRRSISAEQKQRLIRFAAGAYLKHFILRHSPTLQDDLPGAKGHVRNEHAVEGVMASRATRYAARKFITKYAVDPRLTKALEKCLARNEKAIRQTLSEELARR
jgi:hypothetical protein